MDPLELNRAHWDALAAVHGQDAYYDKDALVAGRDSLNEYEAAVGDVTGLDVLHLQCHIGFDSTSLARRGARVTGVDFSPASLATVGVLCWIGDIDAWMRSVHAALRPGGRLVLVELHPLFMMVRSVDPLELDFPYAFDGERVFDEPGSYADPDARVAATKTVEYAHSLGEVVTAAVRAGLRVDALHEHLDAVRDNRGLLTPEADGRSRLRVSGELLPLLYTLEAGR